MQKLQNGRIISLSDVANIYAIWVDTHCIENYF